MSVTTSAWPGLLTAVLYSATPFMSSTVFTSCMKRVSIRSWKVSPVIAMTGALSIFASYSPFDR